jgi:1-acyl-sn-glycerol-3-phosphate acyltransferase
VSQRRGDSPPARHDDLVAVDPHGNVTVESGSGPGRAAYWVLKNVLLGPAITKVFRPITEGAQHVPNTGAAIIASNHLSFADWLFMPLSLDRRITFVAKSDYFTGAGFRGWFQKRFFAGTGQVPIDRSGGRASESALRAGLKVLQRGELFGIYPEGTRSRDGVTHRGHTGVARLALQTGTAIVPVGLIGSDECQPVDKKLPRLFKRVTIRFGSPISPVRYADRGADALTLRQMTDEVMFEIVMLCGYAYRDTYATKTPDAGTEPVDPGAITPTAA